MSVQKNNMTENNEMDHHADYGNPSSKNFKIENYPFYLIDHVDHRYGDEMEKVLHAHRMERARWQVLLVLREKNPSSISELAARSNRKLSTLSRVVERMRKDGLVECAPRKTDNRVTEVFLKDQGQAALAKVLQVAGKQYERALEGFTEYEIEQLQKTLQRILTNLSRSPFE